MCTRARATFACLNIYQLCLILSSDMLKTEEECCVALGFVQECPRYHTPKQNEHRTISCKVLRSSWLRYAYISGSMRELQMMRIRKRLKFRKKQLQKGLVGQARMRIRCRKKGPQHKIKTPSRIVRVMAPFILVDWRLFLWKATMRRECTCARTNMCRYNTALNTRVVQKKVTRHTMTALSV